VYLSDRAKRGSSRAPEILRSTGNRSSQTRGESPGAVSFGYVPVECWRNQTRASHFSRGEEKARLPVTWDSIVSVLAGPDSGFLMRLTAQNRFWTRSAERTRGTFLCLPKEKYPKETAPGDSPLVCDERFPALLAISGARELPRFARSDMHALLPEIPAMLGIVNGTKPAPIRLQGAPPLGAAEHRRTKPGEARTV